MALERGFDRLSLDEPRRLTGVYPDTYEAYLPLYSRYASDEYLYSPSDSFYHPQTDKCLVLDLDETLVYSNADIEVLNRLKILKDPSLIKLRKRVNVLDLDDARNVRGSGSSETYWCVTRPDLMEFLTFCSSYFSVLTVWSAGRPSYVHRICECLFRDLPAPVVIYTSEDCLDADDIYGQASGKPLTHMFKDPRLKGRMNLSNTFIVDDREDNFKHNPENGILIPGYKPSFTLDGIRTGDPTLNQLREWFLRPEVRNAGDIRDLPVQTIFS